MRAFPSIFWNSLTLKIQKVTASGSWRCFRKIKDFHTFVAQNPSKSKPKMSFSLIFIDFHWIYSSCSPYTRNHKRCEHQKCTLAKFHAEIFLGATANYVTSTMPKNWVDSLIFSCRKKFHKMCKFTCLEIIKNAWFSLIFMDFHWFSMNLLVLFTASSESRMTWAPKVHLGKFSVRDFSYTYIKLRDEHDAKILGRLADFFV